VGINQPPPPFRLTLKCEDPLSNFAVNSILRRYIKAKTNCFEKDMYFLGIDFSSETAEVGPCESIVSFLCTST